jgi:Fe-S-cluster containining protein
LIPAIAARSFKLFQGERRLRKIAERLMEKLKSIKGASDRARFAHDQVDYHLSKLFEEHKATSLVSCKAGCTACCHTQVSVTSDEAQLLIEVIANEGIEIDLDRLRKQAETENDGQAYLKVPYGERRCVFLGDDNRCRVYSDRPSVCRTNYTFSPPEDCETKDGKEKQQRLLKTVEADMVIAASFSVSPDAGALPFMLTKALKRED